MGSTALPEGYLEFCSLGALESLALSRMNGAAILRKQVKALLFQLVQAEAEVQIVRWIMAKRRLQELRQGARSKIQYAVAPVAVPRGYLLDGAEVAADSSDPSTRPNSARPAVLTVPPARKAAAQIRALRPTIPLRASRGVGAALTRYARRTHAACRRPCRGGLLPTSKSSVGTIIAETLFFEPYRGQIAVGFHPPPDWQFAEATTRARRSPERAKKRQLGPTPVIPHAKPAPCKQPSTERSGAPRRDVSRLKRTAAPRRCRKRARSLVVAFLRNSQPSRSVDECRLASAS